ncbi:MAG TPA: hypothetical protein VEI99_05675 [Terriglobales bacterium]|nr:hypothetical protein [Terriglobales bacterium]
MRTRQLCQRDVRSSPSGLARKHDDRAMLPRLDRRRVTILAGKILTQL